MLPPRHLKSHCVSICFPIWLLGRDPARRIITGALEPYGVKVHSIEEREEKAELRGFPEVRALYATNGRWDLVAEIETRDLPAFDALLRRIREVDGIGVTETNLLLAARKAG